MKRNADLLEALDGRNGVWNTRNWCDQAGMSHVKKLTLPVQPHQTKIGRILRITESPAEYFARVRELQRAAKSEGATEQAGA